MIEARRKFVNSVLLLTGTIGLCKSIPVARACGATDDGPVYYPISHQLDFSQARLADYLKKYYGSELPLKQTDALIIQTEINPGATFAAQLDVEIPQQYIERNFDDIQCSHIDIFSQVMDGILEGPIYRIASYSLGQNTHPSIGLRYRRDFTYSRVIIAATLINTSTKNITGIIYKHSDTLKGGGPCNVILPKY